MSLHVIVSPPPSLAWRTRIEIADRIRTFARLGSEPALIEDPGRALRKSALFRDVSPGNALGAILFAPVRRPGPPSPALPAEQTPKTLRPVFPDVSLTDPGLRHHQVDEAGPMTSRW